MKSILWLNEVNNENISEVGVNASTLGELVRNEIFVPNGFIITATSFWNFLEEADIKMRILDLLKSININEKEDLIEKSSSIQEIIRNAETPWELDADIIHAYRTLSQKSGLDRETVSLRCAIAYEGLPKGMGGQESFLNVKNERELLEKVKQCWVSFFSSSSISSRIEGGLNLDNVGVSIAVQKMINSSVSGNLLTSYPTPNQIIIEASYGLRSTMLEQEIIPDKYLISKELIIEDKTIGKQTWKHCLNEDGNTIKENIPKELETRQKLSDEYIMKLAEIGKKIEELFKEPMNIEWCIDGQEIFVISSKSTQVEKKEILKKVEEKIEEVQEVREEEEVTKEVALIEKKEKIEEFVPITATEIFINLEKPENSEECSKLPIQGVLTEQHFIISNFVKEHPLNFIERGESDNYINILTENFSKIARAIYPKKVILRLSNLRTNEYRNLIDGEKYEPIEKNPIIGLQGCAKYLSPEFESVFRLELTAIKKVREEFGLKNLWIMIPFVRTINDAKKVFDIMNQEGLENNRDFKVFMNIEVPSNIFLIKEFAKIYDGFYIDLKNLAQLIMGADFNSEILKNMGYCDIRDEAIFKAINSVVETAQKKGCTVSIFGEELSNYHDFLEFLVRIGIDSISFDSDKIEEGIRLVASLEKKILLERLRSKNL